MVNTLEFSKRLQKILEFYGLSATAFSEKVAFNRSTISHLLSGRNKPSLEFVMKVLEEFPEVELYWLLNGKGSFPPTSKIEIAEKPVEASEDVFDTSKTIIEKKDREIKNVPVPTSEESVTSVSNKDSEIDQIVIFYKDGSFKAFK
ncbi:MAG: helix-turn-helix transcriptional regulator [Aureisphaera sp.]